MKKERALGLDILRILLAFMVLILHFNGSNTGAILQNVSYIPNKLVVIVAHALCYPAVNCYVIISGYFAYKQNKCLKEQFFSLVKIYFALLFYSLLGYIVSLFCGNDFDISVLICRLFPLTTGQWWYMSCYFMLMIISPYVNKLLKAINLQQHKVLLLILLVPFSIMPIFLKLQDAIGVQYGYSFSWFLVLYVTGAYLYKKESDFKVSGSCFLILYFILSAILQFFSFVSSKIDVLNGFSLASYNSIIVYLQAVFLVLYFKSLKVEFINERLRNRICKVASLSMALYLVHCQTDFEKILWSVLAPKEFCNEWFFVLVLICVSILLFSFSCIIEHCRKCIMSCRNIENIMAKEIVILVDKVLKRM